ncbi:outer membrane protein assembly factor BamB family protein [Aporhodopirellula aestuarii]|uniref:PQQ-binding-like beta-propeller repeat protein n=1 Tax=Aporhodopirellula aestuarii TaxID=2950107 RepID=A0ABT0TX48_9BACT|nr:PQQ-binding-like beta-propeller repeat protein [Aporhodopirellula aestuarii]MCM2369056.1 PQQ-binding-like beta-propeller repeat protein [Aporhodopirellula aestuarii]
MNMFIVPGRLMAACLVAFSAMGTSSCFAVEATATRTRGVSSDTAETDQNVVWPQWRGPSQQGVSLDAELPVKWSEETALRVEIPGSGGSTPVVVGNTAFLTSGVDGKNMLFAIDLEEPRISWQVPMGSDRGNKHRKGSGSNPSPVTDGEHVVAYFRSGDLVCVNLSGEIVWQHNLQDKFGEDSLWWDLGSSPLLVDSMVVIPVMQTGPSYLVAFDVASGEMKWKTDRSTEAPEEAAQSYTTPLAVEINGESAIAVMGADNLTINRASDGKELARLGGFNPGGEKFFRSISSPVADGNLIFCPYSRGATLTAVDMEQLVAGKGKDAIVWFRDDVGSDVPTPAARDGVLYVVSDGKRDKGTVYALSQKTGETLWTVQLPRTRQSYSSSPLIAGDRLYVTGEDARTSVIAPLGGTESENGGKAELVSTNEVADTQEYTVSSPISLGDRLALRTKNFLYLIGN